MKITFSKAHPAYTFKEGQTVDLPNHEARQFIASGHATPAAQSKGRTKKNVPPNDKGAAGE